MNGSLTYLGVVMVLFAVVLVLWLYVRRNEA